jgi:hypothetical protein
LPETYRFADHDDALHQAARLELHYRLHGRGRASSETRSRVAEQQPWALLDICEEQNLEIPRYGTREKGDPLANVLPRVPHKPPEPPHATREIPRDALSSTQVHKRSYFALT